MPPGRGKPKRATTSLFNQYFPRSMDFTSIDKDDIRMVMDRLIHWLLKPRVFKIPCEVFFDLSTNLIPCIALTN